EARRLEDRGDRVGEPGPGVRIGRARDQTRVGVELGGRRWAPERAAREAREELTDARIRARARLAPHEILASPSLREDLPGELVGDLLEALHLRRGVRDPRGADGGEALDGRIRLERVGPGHLD